MYLLGGFDMFLIMLSNIGLDMGGSGFSAESSQEWWLNYQKFVSLLFGGGISGFVFMLGVIGFFTCHSAWESEIQDTNTKAASKFSSFGHSTFSSDDMRDHGAADQCDHCACRHANANPNIMVTAGSTTTASTTDFQMRVVGNSNLNHGSGRVDVTQ